mmetsp:Transcript_22203/g.28508  ORF Transcript_22203/g.28508 Transcript_22203/m.28508 type:complete len:98 (+) Transcript_22203:177-470(+)
MFRIFIVVSSPTLAVESLVFDLSGTTLTIESTSSIAFFAVSKVMCIYIVSTSLMSTLIMFGIDLMFNYGRFLISYLFSCVLLGINRSLCSDRRKSKP